MGYAGSKKAAERQADTQPAPGAVDLQQQPHAAGALMNLACNASNCSSTDRFA